MPPASLVPASALRSLLTLVVVAAFLVMGMVALSWLVRLATEQWLAASVATAVMGGLTARLATRSAMAPGASVGRTVGWSLLLGLANVPVSFIAASVVRDVDVRVLPMAAVATVFGAPFGLVLGLLFGLALSIPVAALMRAWQRPSADANDLAALVCGLWLALAAGLAAMLATPTLEPELWLRSDAESAQPSWVPLALAWIMGGVGTTLAAAAWLSRAARRRFVARVAMGRLPTWRVAEAPRERDGLDRLPCMGETVADCDHLLLRCECAGSGAYRRAASEWPVAWVPGTWLGALPVSATHAP